MRFNHNKNLSTYMRHQAVQRGLCQQWTDNWSDGASRDEMLQMFVDGIDFCIQHNWPSVEEMKRHFPGVMQKHGVFADERVMVRDAPMTVLNGECDCSASFGNNSIGDIYVRHRSVLRVRATDGARVFVTVLDNASVEAWADDGAKIFVYRYGGGRVDGAHGDVVVRDKGKPTP